MSLIKKHSKRIMVTLQIMLLVVCLTSCYEIQELIHYINKDNFITDIGIITSVSYSVEFEKIYISFEDVDERYEYTGFMIGGKNKDILLEKNIMEKVSVGDEVKYTSAPGYFGDGYIMPIVSLSINGEELLSFEEGYKNLILSYW